MSKPWGFDAVSSYARPGEQANFSDLTKETEKKCWANAVYGQAPYVPIVTTGWDKNPRKDNPVSWERGSGYAAAKRDGFTERSVVTKPSALSW